MKYYSAVLLPICVFAQQSTTFTFDINGQRQAAQSMEERRTPGETEKRVSARDVNGRAVPVVESEERVVSDDGRVRVVERLIRRYSPEGRALPPERLRIQTEKAPDGAVRTTSVTERANLNGRYEVAERTVGESRTRAATTTASMVVERPSANGGFETVEKWEQLRRENSPSDVTETTTVYRRDPNGRLEEAARSTLAKSVQNGTEVENAATYESGALVGQTVTRTVRGGNTEHTEMDVFTAQAAGRAETSGPALRERRIIERTYSSSGSVEQVAVQLPDPSNPGRLSRATKIEETVCTGCKPQPPR